MKIKLVKIFGTFLLFAFVGPCSCASDDPRSSMPDPSKPSDWPSAQAWDHCVRTSLPVLWGYDLVAYFSLKPGEPAVHGLSVHQTIWNGRFFYFSSSENQMKFEEDPGAYLPQFGGFCAYGVTSEPSWTPELIMKEGPLGNPDSWIVLDRKLYLFM